MQTTEIEFAPGIVLYPKQQDFIRARSTFRHRRFVGGRQSGKTEVGAGDAFLFATVIRPGGTGAIIGPDFPRAMEARGRFDRLCPYEIRSWNGTERRWKIRCPDGKESTVWWLSLSDPDAARGKVLDWAWLDECAMYSEEAMDNLRPCFAVRDGHSWGTTTPKGMNWLERETREDEVYFVHAESRDNPQFPEHEWQRAMSRHGEDSPFFKQEYRGLFTSFVGQAVPAFDRIKHYRAAEFNPDHDYARGWDFGWWPAHTACVPMTRDADDNIVIYGCQLWRETERYIVLSELPTWISAHPRFEAIDPSGANPRAAESGDRGWRADMEAKGLDVRWTRKIGESGRLQTIRTWVRQGKLTVAKGWPGSERVVNALETAELKDSEADALKDDQHPQADIIDAIGYVMVEWFPDAPEPRTYVI